MKNNQYMKDYEPYLVDVVEVMKQDPDLEGFNDEELMGLLFKMRVFQIGLSTMHTNGLLPQEFTEDMLIAVLSNTGDDIITATRSEERRGGKMFKKGW